MSFLSDTIFYLFNFFGQALLVKIIFDLLTMWSSFPFSASNAEAAPNHDHESKSYRELQDLCRTANLSVKGNTQALKKRLSSAAAGSKTKRVPLKNGKRDKVATTLKDPPQKKIKPSPAEDLICPITTELPVDPVVAEDGRTYE